MSRPLPDPYIDFGAYLAAQRRRARLRQATQVFRWIGAPTLAAVGAMGVYWSVTSYQPTLSTGPRIVRPGKVYRTCAEVRAAGLAPAYRGAEGYARHLDADGDGVACEWYSRWR